MRRNSSRFVRSNSPAHVSLSDDISRCYYITQTNTPLTMKSHSFSVSSPAIKRDVECASQHTLCETPCISNNEPRTPARPPLLILLGTSTYAKVALRTGPLYVSCEACSNWCAQRIESCRTLSSALLQFYDNCDESPGYPPQHSH